MRLNHLILFMLLFTSSALFSQTSYVKKYALTIAGLVTDQKNAPIANATIKTTFNAEPVNYSSPKITEITTDSSGNYTLVLKEKGLYVIEFMADKQISYKVECLYTAGLQEGLIKRLYEMPLNVQLRPQTKKIKTDIYSGGKLVPRSGNMLFIPHKQYLQGHDYKVRKGFKKTEKLNKYIAKRIKKLQLPKILGVVATRADIDSVINNNQFDADTRAKWQLYFGKTDEDFDKRRLEYIQDFFAKISTKDEEGKKIYTYESHVIDVNKTKLADETKQVFQVYKYNFSSTEGKKLSFDIMLFHSEKGWKINYISENYE